MEIMSSSGLQWSYQIYTLSRWSKYLKMSIGQFWNLKYICFNEILINMKKSLLICFVLLLSAGTISAQDKSTDKMSAASTPASRNLLKVNLLSLPLNNFSFEYERKIARKITLGIGYRFMPESGVPLKSTVYDLIDDPETSTQLDQFKTSNSAITPQIRFYMGKQAMRGFYLAPFARFSNYEASGPIEFEVEGVKETIPLTGKLNTVTGGLLIGAQWKLGGRVYLDWWMLGPQYGTADGNFDGQKSLTPEEQNELRQELEGLEIPFAETQTTVDANGARMDVTGPWAGVRAGLCLGIRF